MHVNTAINELKVKQYGYNAIKELRLFIVKNI